MDIKNEDTDGRGGTDGRGNTDGRGSTIRNEWTDELEKQLQYIGECSQGYTQMYKMDILRYSTFQQRLTSLIISSGIISGALLTLSLALGIDKSQAMVIISTFLSFGTSVGQGYLYQIDYASIISELKRQAAKYSGLQNNIKRQLSMPRNKREKAKDYHYWITNSYDQLGETSLHIHPETITLYRTLCQKEKLPFPDEFSSNSRIIIHTDSLPDTHAFPDTLNNTIKDGSLRIQEALKYTDQHMHYELTRLAGHSEE